MGSRLGFSLGVQKLNWVSNIASSFQYTMFQKHLEMGLLQPQTPSVPTVAWHGMAPGLLIPGDNKNPLNRCKAKKLPSPIPRFPPTIWMAGPLGLIVCDDSCSRWRLWGRSIYHKILNCNPVKNCWPPTSANFLPVDLWLLYFSWVGP